MNVSTGPRRELPVAAFLMAFGGLVVAGARGIPPGVPADPLGPRAFPMALGVAIASCGLLLAAAAFVFRGQPVRVGTPHLDLKTRALVTLVALSVQGRISQLRGYIGAALRQGRTREEIVEAIVQLAPYQGVPLTHDALAAAREVFEAQPR